MRQPCASPPPFPDTHLCVEALDHDGALLPHAPAAPDGLLLQRRVQAWLHEEDVGGSGEVDAHCVRREGEVKGDASAELLKETVLRQDPALL